MIALTLVCTLLIAIITWNDELVFGNEARIMVSSIVRTVVAQTYTGSSQTAIGCRCGVMSVEALNGDDYCSPNSAIPYY